MPSQCRRCHCRGCCVPLLCARAGALPQPQGSHPHAGDRSGKEFMAWVGHTSPAAVAWLHGDLLQLCLKAPSPVCPLPGTLPSAAGCAGPAVHQPSHLHAPGKGACQGAHHGMAGHVHPWTAPLRPPGPAALAAQQQQLYPSTAGGVRGQHSCSPGAAGERPSGYRRVRSWLAGTREQIPASLPTSSSLLAAASAVTAQVAVPHANLDKSAPYTHGLEEWGSLTLLLYGVTCRLPLFCFLCCS